MQRLRISILVLVATLGILVILAMVSWYLSVSAPSYYGSSWIGQMWGSMAGNSYGGMGGMMGNGGSASPSYYWVIPVALITAVAVAIIGVGFYLIFPEVRYIKGEPCNPQKIEPKSKSSPEYDFGSDDLVAHCEQRFWRNEQLRCTVENDDCGRAEGFHCLDSTSGKVLAEVRCEGSGT